MNSAKLWNISSLDKNPFYTKINSIYFYALAINNKKMELRG